MAETLGVPESQVGQTAPETSTSAPTRKELREQDRLQKQNERLKKRAEIAESSKEAVRAQYNNLLHYIDNLRAGQDVEPEGENPDNQEDAEETQEPQPDAEEPDEGNRPEEGDEAQPLTPDQKIAALEPRLRELRRELAKLSLEQWKLGQVEELDHEDLAIITEDIVDCGEKSALAEMFLSMRGFKNFEHALRKLKLSEATSTTGETKELDEESILARFSKAPAVQDFLKKLGISSGISVAIAGAVVLAGGPISWATVAAGLSGGAVGRFAGEMIRTKMLHKYEEKPTGGRSLWQRLTRQEADPDQPVTEGLRFNEAVGRELLDQIIAIQSRAEKAQELSQEDQNHKAQVMLNLITDAAKAAKPEAGLSERYKKMEKRATIINRALTLIGAIGGSTTAALLQHGQVAEQAASLTDKNGEAYQQALSEAQSRAAHEGMRLDLDHDMVSHTMKQVDGAWRFVIEQGDVGRAIDHAGQNYGEVFHYYAGDPLYRSLEQAGQLGDYQAAHDAIFQATGFDSHLVGSVQDVWPTSTELVHNSVLNPDLVKQAISEVVMGQLKEQAAHAVRDSLITQLVSVAAVAVPFAAVEGATAKQEKNRNTEIRKDNERFIDSLEEIEEHVHDKLLFGFGHPEFDEYEGYPAVGHVPEDKTKLKQWFERLANYYNKTLRLPDLPKGLEPGWEKSMEQSKIRAELPKLQRWLEHKPDGSFALDESGNPLAVRVAEVDLEKNRIVIVQSDQLESGVTASYFKPMRLDLFLKKYVHEADIKPGGKEVPPTDPEKPEPPDNKDDNKDEKENRKPSENNQEYLRQVLAATDSLSEEDWHELGYYKVEEDSPNGTRHIFIKRVSSGDINGDKVLKDLSFEYNPDTKEVSNIDIIEYTTAPGEQEAKDPREPLSAQIRFFRELREAIERTKADPDVTIPDITIPDPAKIGGGSKKKRRRQNP